MSVRTMQLSDRDWSIIVNALHTAADTYRAIAREHGQAATVQGNNRLSTAFEWQAETADALADHIAGAVGV